MINENAPESPTIDDQDKDPTNVPLTDKKPSYRTTAHLNGRPKGALNLDNRKNPEKDESFEIPEDLESSVWRLGKAPKLRPKEMLIIRAYTDSNSSTFGEKAKSYLQGAKCKEKMSTRNAIRFFRRPKIVQAIKYYYQMYQIKYQESNELAKERILRRVQMAQDQLLEPDPETGQNHITNIPQWLDALMNEAKLRGMLDNKLQIDVSVTTALQSIAAEERPILQAAVKERLLQLGQQREKEAQALMNQEVIDATFEDDPTESDRDNKIDDDDMPELPDYLK